MARGPFDLPSDLHVYPANFRIRPLDFELEDTWAPVVEKDGDYSTRRLHWMGSFGDLWLSSLGGRPHAARFIRRTFEKKVGPETQLFPRRPLLGLKGPEAGNVCSVLAIRAATEAEAKERDLGLLAVLMLTGTSRHPDKGVAISLALDVSNLSSRLNRAMRHGMLLGLLQRSGVTGERALQVVATMTKRSVGTVRKNSRQPLVKAIMTAFATAETLRAESLLSNGVED